MTTNTTMPAQGKNSKQKLFLVWPLNLTPIFKRLGLDPHMQLVASEANPRFTTVIVNRLWKEVFGLALVEPLDNMFDDTMATHPELQLHLEKVMVALNYDLKEFLRILYNTQAFQREWHLLVKLCPETLKTRLCHPKSNG